MLKCKSINVSITINLFIFDNTYIYKILQQLHNFQCLNIYGLKTLYNLIFIKTNLKNINFLCNIGITVKIIVQTT